jgi:hypothetical protein
MKIENAVIASFMVLLTGIASVVAKECYGTTQNNAPSGANCTTASCTYTCASPIYSVCAVSATATGSTCNEGPEALTNEVTYTYSGGTCAGFSVGPPVVQGTCTGGTANSSGTQMSPQPKEASMAGC